MPNCFRHIHLFICLLCGLSILANCSFAADKTPDTSHEHLAPLSLTEYFSVLEDSSQTLTLADVQQPEIAAQFKGNHGPTADLNYGFSRSAYWLRIRMRNESDQPIERILELGSSLLSNVQLHLPTPGGAYFTVETGRAKVFSSRLYPHRFFVFPLTLAPQSEQVYYLRIQSISIEAPVRLWTPQAFHAYETYDYFNQALFFGLAIGLILFNLMLFVVLRDAIYLLYVVFVTFMVLAIAAQNGLDQQFLWPGATSWSEVSMSACFAFSVAAYVLFMRSMLSTAIVLPRIDRMYKLLIGIILLVPLALAVSLQTFVQPAIMLNLITMIMVLGTGLFCAFRRQRTAYFFVGAFALLFLGGVINALRALGALPTNILTINGLQVGAAAEMLLLAFALADRFNTIRQERELAQQEILLAGQRANESLRLSEQELEGRVDARTAELSETILRLEQTQAELAQANERALLAAQQDIAERKQNETELLAAKTAAETASLTKSRFLAAASHDLRQPMQAISLFSEALKQSGLNKKQERISTHLSQSIHSLGDLLDALLDISKLDAGVVTVRHELIHSQTLMQRIDGEFSSMAAEKSLRFMLHFSSRPLALNTDGKLIMSLLGNLIGNAIKYTFSGGVLVAIRRRGDRALIQVWDTGIGIAPVHLDSIFDEYFQIGNPERDRTKGLGLGLAITRRLGKLLGTELVCRSRLGKGSVFQFSLPLADPVANGPSSLTERPEAGFCAESCLNGRLIVVVEDDAMVAKALQLSLESLGARVACFGSAEAALAAPDIADTDFYIADFQLPGANGVDFLNNVSARSTKPIRAVLLTGQTSPHEMARFAASNLVDAPQPIPWTVLFKPVNLPALVSVMEAVNAVSAISHRLHPG